MHSPFCIVGYSFLFRPFSLSCPHWGIQREDSGVSKCTYIHAIMDAVWCVQACMSFYFLGMKQSNNSRVFVLSMLILLLPLVNFHLTSHVSKNLTICLPETKFQKKNILAPFFKFFFHLFFFSVRCERC